MGARLGRDRGRRGRGAVRGLGARPRRRLRPRRPRARGRPRRHRAVGLGAGDAVPLGRPLRARARPRQPAPGRPPRGGGRGRRTHARGSAALRRGRPLPRPAGACLRPRRVVRGAVSRAWPPPRATSKSCAASRPTCGGGRTGATPRGRRAFDLPRARGADARGGARPGRRSRWTATSTTAAGRRRGCAGSSSTAAATTSGPRSRRPRPGPASTTSRRGSASPATGGGLPDLAGRQRPPRRAASPRVAGPRLRTGRAGHPRAPARRAASRSSIATSARAGLRGIRADHAVFALPALPRRARGRRSPARPRTVRREYGAWMVANLTLRDRPAVARLPPRLGQRPLRQPVPRLRGGHAPDRAATTARPCSPITCRSLDDDPRAGAPAPAGHAVGAMGRAILADLAPRAPRPARPRGARRRLPLGARDGAPAAGFAVERRPGRRRPPCSDASTSRTPTCPGMALFEEAQYWGVRAAEEILAARGDRYASSLAVAWHAPPPAPARAAGWCRARWDLAVFGGSALARGRAPRLGRAPPASSRRRRRRGPGSRPWCWWTSRTCGRPRTASTSTPTSGGGVPACTSACPSPSTRPASSSTPPRRRSFWRVLAYVAVFHFVRQQYGWVALYRRRLGHHSRLDRVLDDAAIYSRDALPAPLLARAPAARVRVVHRRRLHPRPARGGAAARSCPSTSRSPPPTSRARSGSPPRAVR